MEQNESIVWVTRFLKEIIPQNADLIFRDELQIDECFWFRQAIEQKIVDVRECMEYCPRAKKNKVKSLDEFMVISGVKTTKKPSSGIRHLFSNSDPVILNREYIPHVAAYAKMVIKYRYDPMRSSFSLSRKFLRDTICKKQGQRYETDAEFYDLNNNVYLHVEVKKNRAETEKVVAGISKSGKLLSKTMKIIKEFEYVLDLKPKYLWIVGPNSLDPEKHVYQVHIDDLEATFVPIPNIPYCPYSYD